MSTTWEEARKCPKCQLSGEPQGGPRPSLREGVKILNVFCKNEQCTWFGTSWLVQINEDGSIPDAAPTGAPRGEKQFGNDNLLSPHLTTGLVDKINREAAGMDKPGVKELGTS